MQMAYVRTRGSNVRLREGMDQVFSGSSDGVGREKRWGLEG